MALSQGEEHGVAEQAVTSRVAQDSTHQHASHHGRPSSWIAVSIIVVGFVVGGIAITTGPTWWLFWLGTGIAVVGCIAGAATRILDDWY